VNSIAGKDLQLLIQQMHPHLSDEKYAFVSVQDDVQSITPFAIIREKE
jgi:hypothetical protein